MNLLIDAGNTRIKWALNSDDRWRSGGCRRNNFAEQLGEQLGPQDEIDRILVSSTRNQSYNSQLADLLLELLGRSAEFIVPKRRALGVINRYQPESALGTDRWAAMIAAYGLSPSPAVVIDCGTAITVDAVNADGIFEGGVIFPGLQLALESLRRTDNLESVTPVGVSVFARNSEHAMYSGVVLSIAGGIDAIVQQMRKNLGYSVNVYICGGNMDIFAPALQHNVIKEPQLVLKGLKLIADAS